MSKKKKQKPQPYQPNLSPEHYERYYIALEQGEVAAHENEVVYWDLGPGERPDKVLADFRYVAKKEKIPALIEKGKRRTLVMVFYSEAEKPIVRVRRGDQVLTTSDKELDADLKA